MTFVGQRSGHVSAGVGRGRRLLLHGFQICEGFQGR